MSYPKYYYQDINKLASNLDFPCLDLTFGTCMELRLRFDKCKGQLFWGQIVKIRFLFKTWNGFPFVAPSDLTAVLTGPYFAGTFCYLPRVSSSVLLLSQLVPIHSKV